MKRVIVISILLISVNINSFSQNFKWLQTFGNKKGGYRVIDVVTDKEGGGTCVLSYGSSLAKDTFFIGQFKFVNMGTTGSNFFLVKFDSSGEVLKAKFLLYNGAATLSNVQKIVSDDDGNHYLMASIASKLTFDGDSVNSINGKVLFAKFDANLNKMWTLQDANLHTTHVEFHYSLGHLFFVCQFTGFLTFNNQTYSFTYPKRGSILGEIKPDSGTFKWSHCIHQNCPDNLQIWGIAYLKSKIAVAGYVDQDYYLGKDTLKKGTFIIQCDSMGFYEKIIPGSFYAKTIVSDGVNYYLGGSLPRDTFRFGGKIYLPQYKIIPQEMAIVSYTADWKERWMFRPKIYDTTQNIGGSNGNFTLATTNEGYMYFAGDFRYSLIIDSTILYHPNTGDDLLFLKIDYLGNVLWAVNAGGNRPTFRGLSASAGKSVVACGDFNSKISFGSLSANAKGSLDGWLLKISDNSIYRGDVFKGPYCAGDTIKVPYTKVGDFDSSNYFIAQLSDEFGNFEGNYYELGRLKSNQNGTIFGRLPSFQVKSSAMYRIRIISTKPGVQSFYRIDTLRLLIYSRDKADPGPAERICYGDSIKLLTYGGTKWSWSPQYNMDNPNLREPTVWPLKDTTYRIIIADSSGCGAPDTAFKRIIIHSYPKALLDFTDTLVCQQTDLRIPVRYENGDSNYHWQWLKYNSSNSWQLLSKNQLKNADTLQFKSTSLDGLTIRLALALNDGCKVKPDTAFVNIWQVFPDSIQSIFGDTLICNGVNVQFNALNKGSLSKNTRWQWKDVLGNRTLSMSNSLSFLADKTSKIQLTLNNGCMEDTSEFNISVKLPLKSVSNLKDTSLCFGSSLSFIASANGGDSAGYEFNWNLGNKTIATTKHVFINTDSLFSVAGETKKLSLILKDHCSLPNDTVERNIQVIPAPKADFSFGYACNLSPIQFKFTGTQPKSPINTLFNWDFNGEYTSTLENPSQKIDSVGIKKVKLILTSSNGCSDTLVKSVDVKPQAKSSFKAEDACETDSAYFINQSLNAISFKWKFGDGFQSLLTSPKHLYNIGGVTKTFNVMLVAVSGCSDSIVKAITINANPISDFSYSQTGSQLELKATQTNNSRYFWKFGNNDSLVTSNPNCSFTVTNQGQNKVCLQVTNLADCISQTCKNITLGMNSIVKQSGFVIYPNPNSGQFIIEIKNPQNAINIEFYDLLGHLVHQIKPSEVQSQYSVNLNASNGIYIVRLNNGQQNYFSKVTINR
jgi:PKD repeat protein